MSYVFFFFFRFFSLSREVFSCDVVLFLFVCCCILLFLYFVFSRVCVFSSCLRLELNFANSFRLLARFSLGCASRKVETKKADGQSRRSS